jgi:hypothetical protein
MMVNALSGGRRVLRHDIPADCKTTRACRNGSARLLQAGGVTTQSGGWLAFVQLWPSA